MNMLELAIILGCLLFASLLSVLVLSIKFLRLKNDIKKMATAYSKVTQLMLSNNKLDNDVHKESFIKFLSDSRDSAFEYIEEVQAGISSFVKQVDPEISYFKEYGSQHSNCQYQHHQFLRESQELLVYGLALHY